MKTPLSDALDDIEDAFFLTPEAARTAFVDRVRQAPLEIDRIVQQQLDDPERDCS